MNIRTEKASKLVAMIGRSLVALGIVSLLIGLFDKSIDPPHPGYRHVMRHPSLKGDEKMIEQMQRRATKMISQLAGH